MKRIIVLALSTIAIFFGISLAANAAFASFHMCTDNGANNCIGDTTLNVGDHVQQLSNANARNMTITNIDSNCTPRSGFAACERVYITFYNGDYLAMDDNCNAGGPIVKDSTATIGIVWEQSIASGTLDLEYNNQHCASGGTALMGADNVIPHNWELDFNVMSGIYYRINGA